MSFKKFILVASCLLAGSGYSQVFKIDTGESKVEWYGSKVVGGSHNGIISIKSGSIVWLKDTLVSGKIEIDMQSIINTDVKSAKYNKKLVDHLKSDDFFGVQKFPIAKFETTNVTKLKDSSFKVLGKMTIKGITKEVNITAKINRNGSKINAIGEIKLDRTDFNVRYGSGKFFENLGNRMISDEIKLNFSLLAKN